MQRQSYFSDHKEVYMLKTVYEILITSRLHGVIFIVCKFQKVFLAMQFCSFLKLELDAGSAACAQ